MKAPVSDGIEAAASTDLPAILALLTAAGLPVTDVGLDSHPEFLVARLDGCMAGVIGLERFGDVGLLRSLAVNEAHRRQGLGLALTRALEERAARTGIVALVLLTETARDFFQRRGYQVIARVQAPAAVQASSEFRSLCPESAVCLTKRL
jgi:amino-acid N-acetyltransferase